MTISEELCLLCEGKVIREPGKYMMVFALGNGPKQGKRYLVCGTCAEGLV